MKLGHVLSVVGYVVGWFSLTSAQDDGCAVSTEAGFDYEVAAADDFTIYWTVDNTTETITVQAVYEGEGWASVGFSSSGAMVPADSVIGLPNSGTALEYDLSAYSLAGVTESAVQEVSDVSVTQADSTTTLVFTRPLAPTGDDKVTLAAEEGEAVTFIWARGSSNELAFHGTIDTGVAGSVTVGDLLCSEEAEEETDTAASCESSDPDYDFEVSPTSDLALFWSVVDSDTAVSVKAVYQGEGWLGIGWSDNGNMPGSDSVIGLPDEDTALEYDMPDYSQPDVQEDQEITDAVITQSGGVTTLTFTRPLAPTGSGKQVLSVSGSTAWLYAWGASNTFVQHATDGSFSLTLDSCNIGDVSDSGSSEEFAHAWLMVLAWSVFFPFGIFYARFSRDFGNVGFPAHRILQTLGACFAFAGFFTAVAFTEDFGLDHFRNRHAVWGLLLTIFLSLQVGAAVCRPHPPPKGATVQGVDGQIKPAPPSTIRKGWSLLHRSLGYLAIILAVLQCYGGLHLLDAKDVWRDLYSALVALLVAAFVIMQVATMCRAQNILRPRQLSQPQLQPTTGTAGSPPPSSYNYPQNPSR